MSKSEQCIVITTCKNKSNSKKIINTLLSEKLAACIQTDKIKSSYLWQGKLKNEKEIRLTIKSQTDLYPKIEKRILALHNYETPQIIMLKIDKLSIQYKKWIADVLSKNENI